MKHKHLKLIVQEIKRHDGTGDVFNRFTRTVGITGTDREKPQLTDTASDAACIRLTMKNRTSLSVINRFDPATLNIRLERMKVAMSRQSAHPPVTYPPHRTGCSHTPESSPMDSSDVLKRSRSIVDAVVKHLKSRLKHPARITCRASQIHTARHLMNTRGFDARDERVMHSVRVIMHSDANGLSLDWSVTVDSGTSDDPSSSIIKMLPSYWCDPMSAPGRLAGRRVAVLDARAVRQLIATLLPRFNGATLNRQTPGWFQTDAQPLAAPLFTLSAGSDTRNAVANFDDEGSPTGIRTLIKNGIIQKPLDDLHSAADNQRTAGHCVRNEQLIPQPGWRSARLEPGTHTMEKLLNVPGNNVLILQLHQPYIDAVAGQFISGYTGRLLKDGAPGPWIYGGTIAGSLPDLLRSIDAVGNTVTTDEGITCPGIRLSKAILL